MIHLLHENYAERTNESQCGSYRSYGPSYKLQSWRNVRGTATRITCKRCLAYVDRTYAPDFTGTAERLDKMTADGGTVAAVLAHKAERVAAVDLATPDAVRVRAHLDAVLAKINTPHAARVFWNCYNAARTGNSWADADAAISTAAQFANGAALLAPDVIGAQNLGGVDPTDYKHGRRQPLAARLQRLAERTIRAFDTNPNGGTN